MTKNQNLLNDLTKKLAQEQKDHALMARVLKHFDQACLEVDQIYPHGLCAQAEVILKVDPNRMESMSIIVFCLLPAVAAVVKLGGTFAASIVPADTIDEADLRNNDVLPAFPVSTAASRSGDSLLSWWTMVGDIRVQVRMPQSGMRSGEFAELMSDWTVEPYSVNYSSGTQTFYRVSLNEPADPAELPIVKLNKLRQAGVKTDNPYKAAALARYEQAIFALGWGWREAGVEATQAQLDQWLRYVTFEHQALSDEENAAQRVATEELVKQYLPLVQETEVILAKCHEALADLFKNGAIAQGHSEQGIFVVRYLKQYLLEKVGYYVPHIDIRAHRDWTLVITLGLSSGLMLNPMVRTLRIDPQAPRQRLHDIPVTYAPRPAL